MERRSVESVHNGIIFTTLKMIKTIKNIGLILGWALVVYIGIFGVWLALIAGCLDYEDMHGAGYCGGDTLTEVIRVTHAPLIRLIWLF